MSTIRNDIEYSVFIFLSGSCGLCVEGSMLIFSLRLVLPKTYSQELYHQ